MNHVKPSTDQRDRLLRLLAEYELPRAELLRTVQLMQLLAELPPPPDPGSHFPRYAALQAALRQAMTGDDADAVEEAFLELYTHLHMHESRYTMEERTRMDETGGYWSHAGGIAPIVKAGPYIRSDTVSADYGAGNGLQGLLLQKLYPHRKTIQIEISSEAVAIGRRLQRWLDVAEHSVEWIVGDVLDHPPLDVDFIYLYRPVRPVGEGIRFYEMLADTVSQSPTEVTIFSIADCLKDFLPPNFDRFYHDGHLSCFRGPRK
ncbi:MAG: hypothetical protein HQ582_11035 [Planctomycetes bacterium]|nr:hypothetical protein [Planctomycetota bacterium]